MKQLRMRSKHVRIELENKYSAVPAAIWKTLLKHAVCNYCVGEDAKHFLFAVNTVIMLHDLFHFVDDYLLNNTKYK